MNLSDEEIEKVRRLLKYGDEIEAHMEYKAAQKLVYRTWRGFVIGVAGLIGAVYVLRDWLGKVIAWGAGQ